MAHLVEKDGTPRAILRSIDDFGLQAHDVVSLPLRLRPPEDVPLVEPSVDGRRLKLLPTLVQMLATAPVTQHWPSTTTRTLGQLFAAFLIAEDPQRRLDARKAATLQHQISLVQHVLTSPALSRVLIADEVGLGKTIEAGLIIQRLMTGNPRLRVLYLAPARLVGNVVRELRDKLDLDARRWIAGTSGDARLDSDRLVVASINRAVFGDNFERMLKSGPWDAIIVDECHHLSNWDPSGGSPNQGFKLVAKLAGGLPRDGRLILMSGTPHQGSRVRFENLLRLLSDDGKTTAGAKGRVIYRTKDRVRDWNGHPLFPAREVRTPVVVELGRDYKHWYSGVGELYERGGLGGSRARAAGWAKSQALQWTASSVQAGLGYLVRLGMRRLGWDAKHDPSARALAALRPYRGGAPDEPVAELHRRIARQIGLQLQPAADIEDNELWDEDDQWRPDPAALAELLDEGVELLGSPAATAKWDAACRLLDAAGDEKVVLFAQPVETVTVMARVLAERYGTAPSIIIGDQSEDERQREVSRFQMADGPRFLVSSRAGGEGLNMQRARRLIHLDIPWNPMDLEQRIGRIHRFGSRKKILVDTIVVAGSREVDMYRIAREKLATIASTLDANAFESLFSRVMALVPPEELEDILGAGATAPLSHPDAETIGRLVREGFDNWRTFDDEYRQQAEQIRAANPGEATWEDVATFVTRLGAAVVGAGATALSFREREGEIEDVEDAVSAVELSGVLHACGDTGGLPASGPDGRHIPQLGLNLPEIITLLRGSMFPAQGWGLVAVRASTIPSDTSSELPKGSYVAFLRQTLRAEGGGWSEHAVSLHVYSVGSDQQPRDLSPNQAAQLLRGCLGAQRIASPAIDTLKAVACQHEEALMQRLREPSEADRARDLRHAVWPLALVHVE